MSVPVMMTAPQRAMRRSATCAALLAGLTLASALAQPADDDAAWAKASGAPTVAALNAYLKDFAAGAHAQEAQLKLADLIRNDPAPSKKFDGAWQTEWTCPNLNQYPGYTYAFTGTIKDGVYHGVRGAKGKPSSMVLDGKIAADGTAGLFGEVIVGSSLVGLGAARGTPSDFHALAHFDGKSGSGKRIEGRPCTLTFTRM